MLAKKKSVLKTKGKFDSEGSFRTWVEINKNAVQKNIATFRKLIGPESMPRTNSRKRFGAGVKLWAVVKSNAYGHGLVQFSQLADPIRSENTLRALAASNGAGKSGVDGFCVDSFVEGVRLRKEGIKKPILVLGPTLAELAKDASAKDITLSISNFEILKHLTQTKNPPQFHIKLDTGMSRQGFFLEDIPKVINFLSHKSSVISQRLSGVYTHFASAKDINYPTYTDRQFETFNKAVKLFEKAGYKNLVKHVSATGGAMINPKYHLDAVRIGIGLYGLWPAKELELQLSNKIYLKPVLAWKTIVSEVKTIPQGQFVGYDLVERVSRPTKIAILPIGYWHGLPRALSSVGEVLINGRRARILGRVSMDLTVVDVTGIKCQVGDIATLIGKDGVEEISAEEMARLAQTSHYEIVTRLNPLMERVLT